MTTNPTEVLAAKLESWTGKNATPVEQLTISIDDTPGGGDLSVAWGTQKATISFMVH